ncbi:epoxide hydrolase [Iodidimonas gelatinilytica]|uniref:Epoxide hydrolase n=1 Tax=Iodidimonas gelatinilytica TaxID=1236966 RepID=A0A5A7MRN4_9PROT|nr:alpha/beta hydrolase [Iodidimonas gelatinilytica]GEQ97559.1 epoxide hydrolase [Iodidimonas gelatinilytica]
MAELAGCALFDLGYNEAMSDRCTSFTAWRKAGHSYRLLGRQIFCADSASEDPDALQKPVILLVHGFPTSGWDFHKIWPFLTPHYRLIVPDMLGFGFSDKPRKHRYSIPEQADLLEALAAQLHLPSCHILAHDYGDTVAQELMARDNQRAEQERFFLSLCLLNGGLFPETHRARVIQKLLASPFGPLLNRLTTKRRFDKSFSAVFGANTKPDAAELEGYWQVISANDGQHVFSSLIGYMAERRVNREAWVGALVNSHCPVQVINGSADPVSGAHMVARYRQVVRADDDIVELPHIGHYPQLEAPDQVAAHYLRFLQALSG